MRPVKLVAVGDGAVGKTSLLISYSQNAFPTEYIPTVFENYSASVVVDNQYVNLTLWDTAGQHEYDRIRPLSYPSTNCFIICYSVISKDSFDNIEHFWMPEIQRHCPATPFIIVGTKQDMKEDKMIIEKQRKGIIDIVESSYAQRKAEELGSKCYFECSALTQHNLHSMFNKAISISLDSMETKPKKKSKKTKCLIF